MHIHVDRVRRHVDAQKRNRITAGQNQSAVSFAQRMLQSPIADGPAVEEHILHPRMAARVGRMGDETGQPHVAVAAFDRDQRVGQFGRRKTAAIRCGQVIARRQIVHRLVVVPQREMDVRIRQRHPSECLAGMAHFGLCGAQKLPPHRRVEEQIVNFDRRADRAAARRDRLTLPAIDDQFRAASASVGRLRMINRLTSAIDASASPRNPSVPTRNKSSASTILLVACGATASGNSSAAIPQPLSTTRTSSMPPCPTVTSIRVAPASTAFSSSSFTTLAGRSITSPAAILLTTLGDSWRIRGMMTCDLTAETQRRRGQEDSHE